MKTYADADLRLQERVAEARNGGFPGYRRFPTFKDLRAVGTRSSGFGRLREAKPRLQGMEPGVHEPRLISHSERKPQRRSREAGEAARMGGDGLEPPTPSV